MSISLGKYLFERMHQINVNTIFGVPGDFNLTLLDKIYEVEADHGKGSMVWAGNANELNAAYAADGYSRVKGMSCLVTTFGVGEVSALNGVAGAYAESVGMLHVVGVPSISSQSEQLLLHHTLGNGDFTVFHRMSTAISSTTAFIRDIHSAPGEIDRCIRDAYVNQKPVYVGLPANLVDLPVPASLLDTPIDLAITPNDAESQKHVVSIVLSMISKASSPIILVDTCSSRHNCREEVKRLVELTQFPVYTTPMGKGGVDETYNFGGIYVGALSHPDVARSVESADLVLSVGALFSDLNTGSFSYNLKTEGVVEFHSDLTKIGHATYPNIRMKEVLNEVIRGMKTKGTGSTTNGKTKGTSSSTNGKTTNGTGSSTNGTNGSTNGTGSSTNSTNGTNSTNTSSLTQEWLWSNVSSWFRDGDIIITEAGTASFGIVETRFPKNAIGISQVLYASIGYSVGATLGAVMAARETGGRRVILFVGDGALQFTVQELSTMVRNGCTPYIFVLNNDGYTIERLVHGENAGYNDIQPWDNLALLPCFKARDYDAVRVETVEEAERLFGDEEFGVPKRIRMVEVVLGRMDAPENLVKQAGFAARVNAR